MFRNKAHVADELAQIEGLAFGGVEVSTGISREFGSHQGVLFEEHDLAQDIRRDLD